MHEEQGYGRIKMHVTDTHVWTSTKYKMLLDFRAHLDVHIGPFDGFLEGLCHMNACLADLIQTRFTLVYLGGSVAILYYVVHTSVLDQGDLLCRPGPAGQGMNRTNDIGSEP